MIARVLLWSLFDSRTRIEELRPQLPTLQPPSAWIWNDAAERLGLLTFGDELPDWLPAIRDAIGSDPEVAEEFDVL